MHNAPRRVRLFLCAIALLSLSLAQTALAATLSASPSAYTVAAGDVVRVRIVVNSGADAINTAEGVLQFPTDMLDVVSVDKSGSVFSIWVDEPAFSNSGGTVSFSGGVPSPGFRGTAGTVVNVLFHAKRAGTASLSLRDATVRANDGLGTDVLEGTNGTTLTLTAAKAVTPTTTSEPAPASKAPTPTSAAQQEEAATATPPTAASMTPPAEEQPSSRTSPFNETVTLSLGEVNINIMWLLIIMFLLTLSSCIAACFAWYRLYARRAPRGHVSKQAIVDIHHALLVFKEDMNDHLDALEAAKTKRELTAEELTMKADMKANLAVLEKYIQDKLR